MQSVHATKHSISSEHTAYRGMLQNAALRHVYFILAADSHDNTFSSGFVLWPQRYARQIADLRPRVEVTAPCMRFYAWNYDTSLLYFSWKWGSQIVAPAPTDRSPSSVGSLENLTTGSEGLPQLLHGLLALYCSTFLRRGSSVELALK